MDLTRVCKLIDPHFYPSKLQDVISFWCTQNIHVTSHEFFHENCPFFEDFETTESGSSFDSDFFFPKKLD